MALRESVRHAPIQCQEKPYKIPGSRELSTIQPFPYAIAGLFLTVCAGHSGYPQSMRNLMGIGSILGIVLAGSLAAAPPGGQLPFGPGEKLEFKVESSRFGKIGTAVMSVTADTIRGRDAFLLAFDFSAKVILFKASDKTRSWLDPITFSSLRYTKHERSPVSKRDESVDIFAGERRWQTAAGSFASSTEQPLDELSFLYYIRTLPLLDGAVYTVERHFDPARNPVTITVLRRESLEDVVNQHIFKTVVVAMRVRDSRQKSGSSVIQLHITDDEWRTPVRIESSMPMGGTMIMSLQARTVK